MRALEFIRDHVTFKLPYDFSYQMKTPHIFLKKSCKSDEKNLVIVSRGVQKARIDRRLDDFLIPRLFYILLWMIWFYFISEKISFISKKNFTNLGFLFRKNNRQIEVEIVFGEKILDKALCKKLPPGAIVDNKHQANKKVLEKNWIKEFWIKNIKCNFTPGT